MKNEAKISQWLQEHRAEYHSATETIKVSGEHQAA